jgi:hypothetical protein
VLVKLNWGIEEFTEAFRFGMALAHMGKMGSR